MTMGFNPRVNPLPNPSTNCLCSTCGVVSAAGYFFHYHAQLIAIGIARNKCTQHSLNEDAVFVV